jgi:hypothetical protein
MGWVLNAPILYLLEDTDGFRCVWAQRIDASSGALVARPYAVRHLHGNQVATAGGVSTSFGNPVSTDGFVYETMNVSSDIWKLVLPRTPSE